MKNTIFLLVFIFIFAVCTDASLYNDPAAMPGYTNKTSFDITLLGIELKADVEYAVYAPGTYPGSDFTGGNEYIYAYQIFISTQSNAAVDFFSVGIVDGATVDAIYTDDIYGYSPQSAVEPLISKIFAQSTDFIFAGQFLNPGQWSNILIFSSTHLPTIGFGTISGGGLCGMGALATPSILPEPATIVLIAPAVLILGSKNKKHQR